MKPKTKKSKISTTPKIQEDYNHSCDNVVSNTDDHEIKLNDVDHHVDNGIRKNKKQKLKTSQYKMRNQESIISDSRLKAYGINPKKFKRNLKYRKS